MKNESSVMLNEYWRLAKSLDNLTWEQAEQIIGTVLERIKSDIGAVIMDVWVREPGANEIDILIPFVRRCDPGVPPAQNIALTDRATGLLVWVTENRKPIW